MTTLEELLSPNEALKCAKAGLDVKKNVGDMTLREIWTMSNEIIVDETFIPRPKVEVGFRLLFERSAKKRISLFIR